MADPVLASGFAPVAAGPVRRAYVDGPFGQVHLRCTGALQDGRPPIWLLHQSPKSGAEMEALMAALAPHRTCVAPDAPGHGGSDAPPSQAEATIEAYARSVWAAVDAIGHGQIDLFGNHTGSMVAVEMVRQRPEQVGRLVLVSAPVLSPEEAAAFAAAFAPIPLDDAGTRYRVMWDRIRDAVGADAPLAFRARSLLQNLMGGEGHEWGHGAAFAHAGLFASHLAALRHPVTILNPGDELAEATRRAGPLLRNGVVLERPDWTHGLLETRIEALVAILKAR